MKKITGIILGLASIIVISMVSVRLHITVIAEDELQLSDIKISQKAENYLKRSGISLTNSDHISIIDSYEKNGQDVVNEYKALKITNKTTGLDKYILSYQKSDEGISPIDIPLKMTNGTEHKTLDFTMGNSNEITITVHTSYIPSGAYITGVYIRPLSVQFIYFKNSSCNVSNITVDFSTIGNLCDSSGNSISGGNGYIHSIIKNIGMPLEGISYQNTGNPLPSNRKLEITGWLGPAMTVDVTTTINGYQFNRILSAMQND